MIRKYLLPVLALAGVLFAVFVVVRGAKPVPAALPVASPARLRRRERPKRTSTGAVTPRSTNPGARRSAATSAG